MKPYSLAILTIFFASFYCLEGMQQLSAKQKKRDSKDEIERVAQKIDNQVNQSTEVKESQYALSLKTINDKITNLSAPDDEKVLLARQGLLFIAKNQMPEEDLGIKALSTITYKNTLSFNKTTAYGLEYDSDEEPEKSSLEKVRNRYTFYSSAIAAINEKKEQEKKLLTEIEEQDKKIAYTKALLDALGAEKIKQQNALHLTQETKAVLESAIAFNSNRMDRREKQLEEKVKNLKKEITQKENSLKETIGLKIEDSMLMVENAKRAQDIRIEMEDLRKKLTEAEQELTGITNKIKTGYSDPHTLTAKAKSFSSYLFSSGKSTETTKN